MCEGGTASGNGGFRSRKWTLAWRLAAFIWPVRRPRHIKARCPRRPTILPPSCLDSQHLPLPKAVVETPVRAFPLPPGNHAVAAPLCLSTGLVGDHGVALYPSFADGSYTFHIRQSLFGPYYLHRLLWSLLSVGLCYS